MTFVCQLKQQVARRFVLAGQAKNSSCCSNIKRCRLSGGLASSLSSSSSVVSWRNFAGSTKKENVSTDEISDRCDLHVLSSPYPPIPSGPYPPITEFVTKQWEQFGGTYKGDKIATIDGSTGLKRTYQDYYTTMGSLAACLKYEMNIDDDSCVALYCPNHVDYLPISLAVALTGGKCTPINPLYTKQEVRTVLDRSRSSVLIVHSSKLDVAMESIQNGSSIKHVLVVTDDDDIVGGGAASSFAVPEGTVSLKSVVQENTEKAFYETVPTVHRDTKTHPYLLPYSSGTTGLPKGVCLSHENIVANLLQCDEVEGMASNPDATLISPLPYFHIYAFTVSMVYSAWKGMKVITMSGRFDLETFCKLVEEHQPQRSHLVPPILLGLGKHPIVDKYDMSSLKMVISAAAPLGIDAEEAVKTRLNIGVKQAWGMSELSPIGTINPDYDVKSGSVGPLVSSTYGKIIDEQGNSLPPNTSGELLIKGPQVMIGYLDEPEKTRECLSESGWLRTGDVAYYDEDHCFYITDRYKELIKVRGYPVAPAELEALLLTNEHVNDAAVIQVPDERSDEVPRAYVVKKDTEMAQQVSEQDLYEWVKERVAPYKRLDGGVVFTDTIPKSASGKILRRILRDQVKEEFAANSNE